MMGKNSERTKQDLLWSATSVFRGEAKTKSYKQFLHFSYCKYVRQTSWTLDGLDYNNECTSKRPQQPKMDDLGGNLSLWLLRPDNDLMALNLSIHPSSSAKVVQQKLLDHLNRETLGTQISEEKEYIFLGLKHFARIQAEHFQTAIYCIRDRPS